MVGSEISHTGVLTHMARCAKLPRHRNTGDEYGRDRRVGATAGAHNRSNPYREYHPSEPRPRDRPTVQPPAPRARGRPVKTVPVSTTHSVASAEADFSFGIDAEDLPFIYALLENPYSNSIAAVVREYSTNARDSHIEAGNDRPIEVTLPTEDNLFFTVRDFGVGLSLDDLANVYCKFGKSTKRDSELLNGTLGLGCKSALSYALSFTVTAVKGGVKVIAVVTKDANAIGVIRVLDTSATNEDNGVTVSVPVADNDVYRFQDSSEDFFRFWRKGTVLVNGEEPVSFADGEDVAWIDEDVAVSRFLDDSYVVMNNVAYPSPRRAAAGYNYVAYVPTASIHFTLSRESLDLTDLTNETLDTLHEFVTVHAEKIIIDSIESAPTTWERSTALLSWRNALSQQQFDRIARKLGIRLQIPLHGRRAYRYRKDYGRNGTESSEHYITRDWIANAERQVIVTEFPHQPEKLSPRQKERLRHWGTDNNFGGYQTEFILLPKGTNLDALDGRPGVITWTDVMAVESTPAERGPRVKTTYMVAYKGETKWIADDQVPDTAPIVYVIATPVKSYYAQDRVRWEEAKNRFPEARIVELRKRQVDKFLRLYPDAVKYIDYDDAQVALAVAALTDDDHVRMTIGELGYGWRYIPSDQVEDPELQALLQAREDAANSEYSERIKRARKLDIRVKTPSVYVAMNKRYPLVEVIRGALDAEAIFYVNAKYRSLQDNQQGEEQ